MSKQTTTTTTTSTTTTTNFPAHNLVEKEEKLLKLVEQTRKLRKMKDCETKRGEDIVLNLKMMITNGNG